MADSYSVEIRAGRILMLVALSVVVGLFVVSAAAAQLEEGQRTVAVNDLEDGNHEKVGHVYAYSNLSEDEQMLVDRVESGENTTVTNPGEESFASRTGDVAVVHQDGTVDRLAVESQASASEGAVVMFMLVALAVTLYGFATQDTRGIAIVITVVLAVSGYVIIV